MTSISRRVRPKPSGGDSGNTSITEHHSSLIVDNVDMIIQILVRLPVKYLLRSKSVSKTWLSIITDPSFVRRYSVCNRHSVSGLFLNQYSDFFEEKYQFITLDKQKYEFIPLDKQNVTKRKGTKGRAKNVIRDIPFKTLTLKFSEDHGSTKIEQACNGLLCCSYSVMHSCHKHELTAYYIYNPSTKSYKVLPASPFRQDGYRSVHSVSLAFDPLKSPYYEVICYSSNNKKKNQIEIYSSNTSSWRLCKAPFETERREFGLNFAMHKSGVFWNGSLHWDFDGPSVYFDIDQELVKEMPMLPTTDHNNTDEEDGSNTDDDEDDSQSDGEDDSQSDGDSVDDDTEGSMSIEYFGECGGHLYLLQISDPYGSFRLKILEMETDYTGWKVKHHGNLKKMTRQYPMLKLDEYAVQYNHGMDFSILLIEEKEEEESIKMVIRVLDKVISYDLKKKRFKLIHKLPFAAGGPEPNSPGWFEAYQFTESLASV